MTGAVFDFIIIGAGSAGCVLANRLSADPAARVLLLEAGEPSKRRELNIPAAFPKLFKTELDWAFETEAQVGLNNRELYWPRGKTLGGSSALNGMIYMRGHPRDYDTWAAEGNAGWAYKDVLPYFKRLETHPLGPSELHGGNGPLNVETRRYTNPLTRAFVAAGVQAGLSRNDDFSGVQQAGIGLFHVTQKAGARHSAAAAYLLPVLKRANLQVETGARVQRVELRGDRATAVVYRQARQEWVVNAEGAVILSAGAVQSPQLLMLSGIGPAGHLKGFDIDTVLELPGVGKNLWDHLALPVVYRAKGKESLAGAETALNIGRYLLGRRGPLVSNIAEAGAFVHTKAGLEAPDLQFHFGPAYFVDHGFSRPEGHYFTLGPTLVAPRSRGFIALRSKTPDIAPKIQPRYLTNPEDVSVLTEGVALAREIARQAGFAAYRDAEVLPGTSVQGLEAVEAYIRQAADTLYHPAGSCRMGQDEFAVVDEGLKVRGTANLYVVDASIMPNIVRGNTNVPTLMIAEKAADMLLKV